MRINVQTSWALVRTTEFSRICKVHESVLSFPVFTATDIQIRLVFCLIFEKQERLYYPLFLPKWQTTSSIQLCFFAKFEAKKPLKPRISRSGWCEPAFTRKLPPKYEGQGLFFPVLFPNPNHYLYIYEVLNQQVPFCGFFFGLKYGLSSNCIENTWFEPTRHLSLKKEVELKGEPREKREVRPREECTQSQFQFQIMRLERPISQSEAGLTVCTEPRFEGRK